MAGRAEADPLLGERGIGPFGVIRGDQPRDVDEPRRVGARSRQRTHPVLLFDRLPGRKRRAHRDSSWNVARPRRYIDVTSGGTPGAARMSWRVPPRDRSRHTDVRYSTLY